MIITAFSALWFVSGICAGGVIADRIARNRYRRNFALTPEQRSARSRKSAATRARKRAEKAQANG